MSTPKAIGIDLGTCNTCVSVYHNGAVEILTNGLGDHTTPSVVAFLDGEKTVGQWSKNQLHKHPTNIISCIKRLIGRKFNDPKVQEEMKILPYKIVSKRGMAAVEVEFCGTTKVYTPEEISALILLEMKNMAITFLGGKNTDALGAVITVPAYFEDSQRKATIDAAKIAGLTVLRLINEPTAAALAYGYKRKWEEGTILVYDLGGGTFDVSIIQISANGCCEVLAVGGDNHLGGEDFNDILVKYCINEIKNRYKIDISNNLEAIGLLKTKCEKAKTYLCGCGKSIVEIDGFYGRDIEVKMRKEKMDILFQPLVDKTLEHVRNILETNGITKNDIKDVLVIGGSTRIPLVTSCLSKFFDNKNLKRDISADTAVSYGAALMAAHLSKSCDTSIRNIRLLDVIPRSLGTDLYVDNSDKTGYFNVVAKCGTKFPFKIIAHCTTLYTNQDEIDFVVYEGEEKVPTKNNKLGSFTLTNIAPARGGVPRIEITFEVDENTILTVSAVDKRNGSAQSIEIRPDNGRLTDDQIVQMIHEIQVPDVIVLD